MTTTNSLVSHTETVLGGKKKRVEAIRPTLMAFESAKSRKQITSALADCVTDHIDKPATGPGRIGLAAAASGSVLAGLGITEDWGSIAAEVCKNIDSQRFGWLEDTVAGGLVDGSKYPWKREGKPSNKNRHGENAGELPNHSSSFHFQVLRAVDEAKDGNVKALYSTGVLSHMAHLSREELNSDPEIDNVKAAMRAEGLSVKKWLRKIAEFRRASLGGVILGLYPDTLNGRPDPKSRRNVQTYLDKSHTDVWLDEFTNKIYVKPAARKAVQLNDTSLLAIMYALREAGLRVDKDPTNDALMSIAQSNKRHSVRDYLAGLKWDGRPRVDTWLSRYAGAKDTELNRAYGRKFLVGAVRRITQPGVKLRAMPILEGEQNIGKSRVFKTIAVNPDWYTDSLELGCDPKEVIELTEGKWIVEIPELSGMAKRDVEHVKAMVSRDVDKARLAYGRYSTEVPRQFVLGGTTNTDEYLKDRTGNTRFWGVKVNRPDIDALERDRDQLWAEAVQIEATGEAHWLDTAELQKLAQKSVQAREERSPLEEQWIDLLKHAKREGDLFVSTVQMYRAAGLDDVTKRLQSHKTSMWFAAKHAGWASARKRVNGERPYGFVPDGVEPQTAQSAIFDRMSKRFKPDKQPRSRANGPR